MRAIRFKQNFYPLPGRWPRSKPLELFILYVPYALYHTVVPSRTALNQFLQQGRSGGGQSGAIYWSPFELTSAEYDELIEVWKTLDLGKVLGIHPDDIPDNLSLVIDPEVTAIDNHPEYLNTSNKKYSSHF